MGTLHYLLRNFVDDTRGGPTVEFVLIAPVFFAVVLSVFESGWIMTKSMMLDRGLNIAVRDIRLGLTEDVTHDDLKAQVCARSRILKDCEETLLLELTPINGSSDYPGTGATCTDRSEEIQPVTTFNPGARTQLMFVRACVIVEPIFPGIGMGLQMTKDASGGVAMVSYSAFKNEPD